jgi:nitrite reductase (NADH) small subunit
MSSIVLTSESGLGLASDMDKSSSVNNGMSMSTSGTWLKICAISEIPVLGSRRVARQQGIDVAVFRNDHDEVFALLDRCPHKGGPLSQGIVFGKHVACPLHNWAIALGDGKARAPDEGCTPQFKLKVENGFVFLDAQELETHAIDLPKPLAGPILRDSTKSS